MDQALLEKPDVKQQVAAGPVPDSSQMLVSARKTTDFLKSLSHPMRLVILCRLAEGGARVNELESMLDMPQAAVSKQLSRLRDEELVKATRQGRFMVYELADDRARRIVQTLYEEFCGVK